MGQPQNRLAGRAVRPFMRHKLILFLAPILPVVLAGCGKGKY
jgi:hypothetical protein